MPRDAKILAPIVLNVDEDAFNKVAAKFQSDGAGGGELHITIEAKGDDNGQGAYEIHRSWLGDYDAATKTYEFGDAIQQIVNALGKLEASLAKAGKTLDDFYEGAEAKDRLYNKKTRDELGSTYPEELERYAEIAKAPEKYMNDIMSEVDTIFGKFSKTNWQKYAQEKVVKNVTDRYGNIGNQRNAAIEALNSGDLRTAITTIENMRGAKNNLRRLVDTAVPEITRLDNENANKQAAEQARKEAKQARKEADEAQKRAAEIQRKAEEKRQAFQKQIGTHRR